MPGTTRPVPNRLFMVIAQVTALPAGSSVAKVVDAGYSGTPAGAASGLFRIWSAFSPPARQRAAAARPRIRAPCASAG